MEENLRELGGDEAAPTTPAPKNAGQFKPGNNRGGRGRVDTESALDDRIKSRTSNGQQIIEFLVNIMNDPKERSSARIAAAEQLLLRAWGKPTLPIHVDGEIDVTEHILVEFTDEELAQKLEA